MSDPTDQLADVPPAGARATAAPDPTELEDRTEVDLTAGAPDSDAGDVDDPADARREAARHRRRLREVEQQRDELAGVVAAYRRREAESLSPGSRWRRVTTCGRPMSGSRSSGEDGTVSPDQVRAAAERVLAERPHWRRRHPGFDGGYRGSGEHRPTHDLGAVLRRAAGGTA